MRLITAVVRPEAIDAVTDALHRAGVSGQTISEVAGYGRQGGHHEVYRGVEYHIDSIPKLRIEVLVPAAAQQQIIDAIVEAARTGQYGDGKVWSTTVETVVRVRTGETGVDALR